MFRKFVNLELPRTQQTVINIVASVMNMLVTTLISFVLSPYIVRHIGVEANGFVGLSQNCLNYAVLVTTALNSMGSRFLMMAYYDEDQSKFQRYYSSLLFANLGLCAALGLVTAACVWKLEMILQIPRELLVDVKLLFAMIFGNYLLSISITAWSTATFLKNKLYLQSLAYTISSFLRALIILGLFLCLEPTVAYVGVAALLSGMVSCVIQICYKRVLFPKLRAKLKDFSWPFIWELISSGIWNTLSSAGHILTSSIDLLVSNLFVSATAMGMLSISHTMPTFVSTLNSTIASAFAPSLMIDYAQGKLDNLVATIRRSAKIISVICSLPLGFLMVFGQEFYVLWQPTQDARMLHILSVIIVSGRVFFTGMQPLFDVFTVVNKVRENSSATIVTGLGSLGLMYLMLRFTDLGIYAIAGASVICCFFKNILFVIPFSAKYLGLKSTAFYPVLIPSVTCCAILYLWGSLLRLVFRPDSWLTLFAAAAVFAAIGVLLTSFLVLDQQERQFLISTIKAKLRR